MKNAGLAGAIALCGIGLMMIGLGNFVKAPSAMAYTPAVAAAVQDEGEPTIVWYDSHHDTSSNNSDVIFLLRAWSDGTVEARVKWFDTCSNNGGCDGSGAGSQSDCIDKPCPEFSGWFVLSSPTEGLNAAADITFDEVVDGQDLATLLASWGEAPRNPSAPE